MERIRIENINTIDFWNDFWLKDVVIPSVYLSRFDAMRVYMNRKDNTLDIGCGNGWFMEYLRKKDFDRLSGVDFSRVAIEKCREKGFNCLVADCYDLSFFEDSSFDCVASGELLEHVECPEKAFDEMCRVAKNKIVISLPYKDKIKCDQHLWSISEEDFYKWIGSKSVKLRYHTVNDFLIGEFKWVI